jgi:hypothetical protein
LLQQRLNHRDSLAAATTIGELNDVVAAECRRITGRETKVDMKGADLQVAKELTEGVLRGMEHSPSTRLDTIETYGPGGSRRPRADEDDGGYANANNGKEDGGDTPTRQIGFNTRMAGDPAKIRELLADDAKPQDGGGPGSVGGKHGPVSIGTHEFGHVASGQVPETHEIVTRDKWGKIMPERTFKAGVEWEAQDHIGAIVERATGSPYGNGTVNRRTVVEREISFYASTERGETTAEAFADVVLNGGAASSLSHDIYAMVTRGSGEA